MSDNRLYDLFARYHQGTASSEETEELMQMLADVPDSTLSDLLRTIWDQQGSEEPFFSPATRARFLQKLPAHESRQSVSLQQIKRGLYLRMAAAAAVVLLSISAWLLMRNEKIAPAPQTAQTQPPAAEPAPIVPGRDQAVLTLADGRQIVLDTAANGSLTQQGAVKVLKLDGRLTYDSKQPASELLYNIISTPRGGQYQLELADGSKVWLNASSSLRFPIAFTGNSRTVELTGEGYFEVARNASMPFHVKVGDMEVKVLGTQFNINSYSDEPAIRTTLLDGRVQVTKSDGVATLNPGQQAVLQSGQSTIQVTNKIDIDEVMAWKNGRFFYNSAGIETVMRQIARWYDVDIVYEKRTSETISGGLPRSESVLKLLQILEATGKVSFEIKGKQIIVKPK